MLSPKNALIGNFKKLFSFNISRIVALRLIFPQMLIKKQKYPSEESKEVKHRKLLQLLSSPEANRDIAILEPYYTYFFFCTHGVWGEEKELLLELGASFSEWKQLRLPLTRALLLFYLQKSLRRAPRSGAPGNSTRWARRPTSPAPPRRPPRPRSCPGTSTTNP